ncbi:MAG: folylpolyglutamate synthase/dihydrofolate synthase family protein [Candidatus Eisenbacteria bacterium]
MKRLSYPDSIDFLFKLERSGIKLGLDRTVNLLSAIGNPHNSFESIHVAGTNGKGSVACFVNSILCHNGLDTGLFTSPHLVDYRERIRTNGRAISRSDTAALVSELKGPVLEIGASYFEATTALAFEYFKRRKVDAAVVEVGMGGRLDSTNILKPLVSCITSIDLDHVNYLGWTLPKIAREKAGIIKPEVPVVCGTLSGRVSSTINRIAKVRGTTVLELGKHATVRTLTAGLQGSRFEYTGLSGKRVLDIRMPGLHQIANAALATLVAEVLRESGMKITGKAIKTGLREAFWPGRFQVLRRRPLIICDAAHNASGAQALAESLKAIGFRSDITVFAVLRDKDYEEMLSRLSGCSKGFVFTKPETKRALPLYKLKKAGRELGLNFSAFSSIDEALARSLADCPRDGNILICGSLFAIGEAMQYFNIRPYETTLC